MAHTNLLRAAKEYHIQVDIVDSCGKTGLKDFGFTSRGHTWCKMKASKRLRSDQPRNEQSHKQALSIINTE